MHRLVIARTAALSGLLACVGAGAVQIVPTSYSALNGYSGTYAYWDESYSGTGCLTCNHSPLSGGLGDLTDGVRAATSWTIAEAPAGPGPYLGWYNIDPSVTFNFGSSVTVNRITFSFDNAPTTGVFAPTAVVIAGQSHPVTVPGTSGPFDFSVSSLNLDGPSIEVTFVRNGSWTFLSEVTFENTAVVPEASTFAMFTVGTSILGLVTRRRRRAT